MRRILFLVAASFMFLCCHKEAELKSLDVIPICKLINTNIDAVKISCSDFRKISESDGNSGTGLLYSITAVEGNFCLDLRFDSNKILDIILLYPEDKTNFNKGLELTKILSNKIASEFSSYFYNGFYKRNFTNRTDFWNYTAINPVDEDTVEQWWNNQSGYSTIIYLNYYHASNDFQLQVSKI